MQAMCLLAEYANTTADGKLNVLGVFNQINAVAFPARHLQMYVVIRIVSDIGETDEPRNFTLKLLNAESMEMGRAEGLFNFPKAAGGVRPEANIIIPLGDLVFPAPGVYEFAFLVDNQTVAERPLMLNLVTQPKE